MSAELEDLVAPPPREGFREELWERAGRRERRALRRWRALALTAAAVAVAALGAAGVLAFGTGPAVADGTFDRTVSCPVPIQGGVPAFQLDATTSRRFFNDGAWHTFAGQIMVSVGQSASTELAGVAGAPGGFGFPSTACVSAPRVALTHAGLPQAGTFVRGDGLDGGKGMTCLAGSRITVRLHATLDRTNTPVAATVVIRTGNKARPVAYLDWTPKRLVAFLSPDCRNRF